MKWMYFKISCIILWGILLKLKVKYTNQYTHLIMVDFLFFKTFLCILAEVSKVFHELITPPHTFYLKVPNLFEVQRWSCFTLLCTDHCYISNHKISQAFESIFHFLFNNILCVAITKNTFWCKRVSLFFVAQIFNQGQTCEVAK